MDSHMFDDMEKGCACLTAIIVTVSVIVGVLIGKAWPHVEFHWPVTFK